MFDFVALSDKEIVVTPHVEGMAPVLSLKGNRIYGHMNDNGSIHFEQIGVDVPSVNPRLLTKVCDEYRVRFGHKPTSYSVGRQADGSPVRTYDIRAYI